ncbi:MAG: thiamine ABC transporter substrate-binding protein [Armatimonadetes bacterium]|nr:thiamine ABC transporter substrate-binding protein [Armatimonadota bacterium]
MKKFFFSFLILLLFFGCQPQRKTDNLSKIPVLTIYSADNFISEKIWAHTIPIFETKFECKIELRKFNDAKKLLDFVINERNISKADIVVGLDNVLLSDVLNAKLLIKYKPETLILADKNFHFDKSYRLIPVCYNYLAFVYDSESITAPPETFGQMQDGIWRKKIIIENPLNSSLGRGMLFWSVAAFGEGGYRHFWRSIKENIFTITNIWEDAFNIFLAKEAPIFLGYATTPIYPIEGIEKYKVIIPQEGGFKIIEGAGILKSTRNLKLSQQFMEFLLSNNFQKYLPSLRLMFPVNKNINLPVEFESIPIPEKDFSKNLNLKFANKNSGNWIQNWKKMMIDVKSKNAD